MDHLLTPVNVLIQTFPALVILQGKELPAHRPFSHIWCNALSSGQGVSQPGQRHLCCCLGLAGQSAGHTHKGRAKRELKELCSPGIPSGILEKLLPGEGCAIWFCCAEVYIIPLSHIFYQVLQSHSIWTLQRPISDWTRKMLYQLLLVTLGKSGSIMCKMGIPQGGMCSGRHFDYKNMTGPGDTWTMGNPGLCPQLCSCWHHGFSPWSTSVVLNLVKTHLLSDSMQFSALVTGVSCLSTDPLAGAALLAHCFPQPRSTIC